MKRRVVCPYAHADYPKVKLSLKTKTDSGVVSVERKLFRSFCVLIQFPRLMQEFETNGSHDLDKSRTSGSMKTKLKFPEQGELPVDYIHA